MTMLHHNYIRAGCVPHSGRVTLLNKKAVDRLPCVAVSVGKCGNKECPFLHIDPESKMKDCAWYDRGFCRHGEREPIYNNNM